MQHISGHLYKEIVRSDFVWIDMPFFFWPYFRFGSSGFLWKLMLEGGNPFCLPFTFILLLCTKSARHILLVALQGKCFRTLTLYSWV